MNNKHTFTEKRDTTRHVMMQSEQMDVLNDHINYHYRKRDMRIHRANMYF